MGHTSEVFVVPLLPDTPRGQQEYVHEQRPPPLIFTTMHQRDPGALGWPDQAHLVANNVG